MIKIGIVGSDNSHGGAFAKLVNFKNPLTDVFDYPEVKITAIYGHDREHTENVAQNGNIEHVVDKAEDLLGLVDAVMVIFRHGSLHAQYALPFIEAGMPVWIDKPFTVDVKEAYSVIEAAQRKNTLLTGGSTTKFSMDSRSLKYAVENDASLGKIQSGYLNFPGDITSEYSGIFFYGPHMVEMMLYIFGRDVKSVSSELHNDELVVVVKYETFYVILNFAKNANRYFGIVYGEKKTLISDLDTAMCYKHGFDNFYNTLLTKTNPEPLENLVMPVKVLNAIQKSIDSKREVSIAEV